jgi:hypothetical protein
MTVEGVANAKGKVNLMITDVVTRKLWDAWAGAPWESEVPMAEAFVFPKQGRTGFLWDQAMPRAQHDRAVQHCATALNLSFTSDELGSLTSKAIRSGVSAGVARDVRDMLTGTNQQRGRSKKSAMDIGTYAPKDRGGSEIMLHVGASGMPLCIMGIWYMPCRGRPS